MQGFPVANRRFLSLAAGCATLAFSLAAQGSGLDALRDHDPGAETAAPADAGFAAACRASARERLGPDRVDFDRPAHTVLDGRHVVRMDLVVPGQRRDPERVFRAVCVRDAAGQPADAMIFDAPADGIGPRVVAIPGPTPEMRPREPDPGYRIVGSNERSLPPGVVYLPGYDSYGLPGLAVPDNSSWRRRHGASDRRSKSVIETSRGSSSRFLRPTRKSTSTRFGSPATTRMGTGAFIR